MSRSALVPLPWRSGTITTPAPGEAVEQRADLVRVERRAVARDEQRALGAARDRGRDAAGRGVGLAGLRRVVDHVRAGLACRGGRAAARR